MPDPPGPEEAVQLPDGTYCICPDHDVLMPYRHVHWEWTPEEGCPVLVGPDERCGKQVQVFANPAPALLKQGAEEAEKRIEEVRHERNQALQRAEKAEDALEDAQAPTLSDEYREELEKIADELDPPVRL